MVNIMEMCYDGKLVMPANCAVISEEEMTYVDGGWAIEPHWWGYYVYLTNTETKLLNICQENIGLPWIVEKISTAMTTNKNKGYGVKIKMKGLGASAVCNGATALTSKNYKTATKNKIIL